MNALPGIGNALARRATSLAPAEDAQSGGAAFASEMTRVLREVNSDQVKAAGKIQDLVVHGQGTIHDAMVAMSNAEGSFRLLMEMRNRIVDGVNQLLSTQL